MILLFAAVVLFFSMNIATFIILTFVNYSKDTQIAYIFNSFFFLSKCMNPVPFKSAQNTERQDTDRTGPLANKVLERELSQRESTRLARNKPFDHLFSFRSKLFGTGADGDISFYFRSLFGIFSVRSQRQCGLFKRRNSPLC